jgi:hypothetical protein
MNLNEQKLDETFRDKLGNLEVIPPASAWSGIQKKISNRKPQIGIILMRVVGVAALVVLALIAGWLYYSNTLQPSHPVSENKVIESIKEPAETLKNQTNVAVPTYASETIQSKTQVSISEGLNPSGQGKKWIGTEKGTTVIRVLEQRPETSDFKILASLKGFLKEIKINETLRFQQYEKRNENLSSGDKELIALNAQNLSANGEKGKSWEVGFRISPGYSSQSASHSENYSQNMTYSNTNGNADLNGGISVGYKTGKRLKVESGVYYAQNGQHSDNSLSLFSKSNEPFYGSTTAEYFNTPVDIQQGQIVMNSVAGVIRFSKTPVNAELSANLDSRSNFSNALLTSGEFSQVFDFIEVPLFFRYNLVDRKIGIDLLGGVSANWLVGNNAYMNVGGTKENIGSTSGISAFNYSGTVGLGVDYSLGKRISVSIEPRFNYYLNSINKSQEVNYHPYRIGVYSGINYRF